MATVSANRQHSVVELDRTMRDESMRDSGEESDAMDNIVFKRPVTRRMSKAKASTPVASTSTPPVRRRSPRKSSSSSTTSLPRPRSSRRFSQTTVSSTPSSSPSLPQSQSQSQSQSEPQEITDEPTGMSQELALVSVASQEPTINERMEDAESRSEESAPTPMDFVVSPLRAETVSAPASTDTNDPATDTHDPPIPTPDNLEDNTDTGTTGTVPVRTVPVFDTEPKPAPGSASRSQSREVKPSSRTPLALPVFAVTEEAPTVSVSSTEAVPVLPDNFDDSTCSSIGNMSLTFDLSIPTSMSSASTSLSSIPLLEPPRTQNTPRRSPRLSGISASSTVSSDSASLSVKTRASSKLITSTSPRQTRTNSKVKALLDTTEDGPSDTSHASSLFDSTIFTTNKGKEKERVTPSPSPAPSPPPIPSATKSDLTAPFKPPKLRSLSPESDAVLLSLQQSLLPPPPLKALSKSSERPPPLPSAMKRRVVEEVEPNPGSPSKRARFDPDPDPPPAPPTKPPSHSRPARIRVHPANSLTKHPQGTGSFPGPYPPIVVRPAGPSSPMRQARPAPSSSPSRQQLLLQRPAGPPMRVPIGQQRALFPARVVSPVRTGSHGSLNKGSSPVKPRRDAITGIWGTSGSGSGKIKPTPGLIKPSEVLIAPEQTVTESSSPVRAGRVSRLPVPARGKTRDEKEKLGLINEKEKPQVDDVRESVGVPAVGTGSFAENGKLQVPGTSVREPTPPTPLETPGSPGSSTSTLIMDVPLFYQPPTPRLPPIQPRTAEEIIAEGTAREAQRKREGKTAAAAAAALRCLPLTRAPRRIIPDGSALQSWASLASASATGSMTESQKELQRITAANTERNNSYGCVIERIDSFVDIPRPPSPTSRVRTKAQKAREMEKQSRDERAQRRSAARDGDTSTASEPSGSTLAPGDESEWTEPERRGRHVRWARALVREDVGSREPGESGPSVGRGCLARTYELDRHGNARGVGGSGAEARRVVVVRYVYNDEPGFKAWKRGQTG